MSAKPWVQIACVCEKALVEPDNVMSLIRIVDTFTLDVPRETPPDLQLQTKLTAVVLLKSGDVIGEYEIGLQLIEPDLDKKPRPVRKWPVVFNGGEYGVSVKIEFILMRPKLGLYWLDVLWEDDLLTRIPFRLKPRETQSTADAAAPSETARSSIEMSQDEPQSSHP